MDLWCAIIISADRFGVWCSCTDTTNALTFNIQKKSHCMSVPFFLSLHLLLLLWAEWVNFSHVFEWSLAKQIEDDNALVSRELLFSFMQKSIVLRSLVCWIMNCILCVSFAPSHNSIARRAYCSLKMDVWFDLVFARNSLNCAMCSTSMPSFFSSALLLFLYHVCITLDAPMHPKFTQLMYDLHFSGF